MEAEEKYNYKNIEPFKYNSRQEYEQKNKSGNFWFMLGVITSVLIVCITVFLMYYTSSSNIVIQILTIVAFGLSALCFLGEVLWLFIDEYSLLDFMEECKKRYDMRKYRNYIPLEYQAWAELNSVIQLKNGEMYRKYQFINAEKSGVHHITLQLPKGDMIECSTNENMCMFKRLSEVEMTDILIPIKQYHEDEQYRIEMERKEAEIKRQSKINSRITNEDINNLPLFKSMQAIADKTEQDINNYHKEMQSNLNDNQDIMDKAN